MVIEMFGIGIQIHCLHPSHVRVLVKFVIYALYVLNQINYTNTETENEFIQIYLT